MSDPIGPDYSYHQRLHYKIPLSHLVQCTVSSLSRHQKKNHTHFLNWTAVFMDNVGGGGRGGGGERLILGRIQTLSVIHVRYIYLSGPS